MPCAIRSRSLPPAKAAADQDLRYVAAFRTYAWNADIAALAERFFRHCPQGRHVVLADETRGRLPIEGYEVISHTVATEDLGLARQPPGRSLWYNVDYGPYILRRALPGYDRYLFSESDVAVNLDLEPMVARSIAEGIDFISHDIRPAEPDWVWTPTGEGSTAEPWRSLLVMMLFSGPALDHLMAARQALTLEFQARRLRQWPFCEIFVPSTLRDGGFRHAQLAEFAETRHLRNRPRIDINDPRASIPGSLAHSVVSRRAFLGAVIGSHDAASWFEPGGWLRRKLAQYRMAEYATLLEARLAALPDPALLHRFQAAVATEAASREILPGRPALVSSVCHQSRHQDPAREAAGAIDGSLPEDYGFHTDVEDQPWWCVELGAPHALCRVEILNRRARPGRLGRFVIEVSPDGQDWQVVHEHGADAPALSSDPAAPGAVIFVPPVTATHLRLRKLDRGALHLRCIKAFGAPQDHVASACRGTPCSRPL